MLLLETSSGRSTHAKLLKTLRGCTHYEHILDQTTHLGADRRSTLAFSLISMKRQEIVERFSLVQDELNVDAVAGDG